MRVIKLTDEEQLRLAVLDARRRDFEDAHTELRNYKNSLREKYFPTERPFENKCHFDESRAFIIKE